MNYTIFKIPFFILSSFLLLMTFSIFLLIFPVGGMIDLSLIQPWVSSDGIFPYQNNWYLSKLNHSYIKNILVFVYLTFFFLWCVSFKVKRFKPKHWEYGYLFWVSMLCTCTIGLFKAHSTHACPWDMTHANLTGFIWDFSATAGHCFPAGHASIGFALVTGYFVYRLSQNKRAYFYLFTGLILGFAMGWAQMMRGAHFLSHNLWTGWLCLFINFILYIISYKYHLRNVSRSSTTAS